MDEIVVGFLLGVFMSIFGFLTLGASLGLAVFTIRRVQKRGSGLKVILYAIETAIPFSIVGALVWLACGISYNLIALWMGVCLTGVVISYMLLHRTPHGSSAIVTMWYVMNTELTGRSVDNDQKIN